MPYIEAKFSKELDKATTEALKCGFGKAIECIPGKRATWLMVNIEDGKNIFFKGNKDDDSAYLSVSIFGKANKKDYDNLTSELCKIITESTGTPSSRTYITYSEYDKWGWNGSNF